MNRTLICSSLRFMLPLLYFGCQGEPITKFVCDPGYVLNSDETSCIIENPYLTCAPNEEQSIADQCAAANKTCIRLSQDQDATCGTCLDGYKQKDDRCEPTLKCEELNCVSLNRSCEPASAHFDAQCSSCIDPYILVNDECVPISCSRNQPGSILQLCEENNQNCLENGNTAVCGSCLPYFVPEGGDQCRLVSKCKDIACHLLKRSCISETETEDAACGSCLDEFTEVDGICRQILPEGDDPSCTDLIELEGEQVSYHQLCEQSHNKACSLVDDVPTCSNCLAGFTYDEERDRCLTIRSCAELNCAADYRECSEGSVSCGSCEIGYVEDSNTGQCRPIITCDELNCDELGVNCLEVAEDDITYQRVDAYCEVDCGPNAIWNGRRCALCPACDGEGEEGRLLHPTTSGYCICKTRPGYYYSTSSDIGTFPCDEDNDGWVRESARISINSSDPILKANARCNVQTIDEIRLVNEYQEEKTIDLDQSVPLYESVRNDDDQLLQAMWTRGAGLPSYPSGRLEAASINRFTKACHATKVDYNDNGIEDYKEWKGDPLSPALLREQKVFNDFSYFMELHTGWFEFNNGVGTYIIQERRRAEDPNSFSYVDLKPNDSGHEYWRECSTLPDRGWSEDSLSISLDLAGYETEGSDSSTAFRGMNHHSLFKCLLVTNTPQAIIPTELGVDDIDTVFSGLTQCTPRYSERTRPINPKETKFDCSPVQTSQAIDKVMWGLSKYESYSFPEDYTRGCINECLTDDWCDRDGCGGCDNPTLSSTTRCYSQDLNYGKFSSCEVWETCDGIDNDGDRAIDENLGTFGGLLSSCNTGLLGACSNGIRLCMGAINGNDQPNVACIPEFMIRQGSNQDNIIDDPAFSLCNSSSDEMCIERRICPDQAAEFLVNNPEHPLTELIACDNGVTQLKEFCDGIDNDCDGLIDELPIYNASSPDEKLIDELGQGAKCNYGNGEVEGKCAEGTFSCISSSVSLRVGGVEPESGLICQQTYPNIQPDQAGQAERGEAACNDVDDDCDGKVDEVGLTATIATNLAQSAQCTSPFLKYYLDADGDSFGDNNLMACACNEAQALERMTEHLSRALNFDDFNVTAGQLLPDYFSGDWRLDFTGANQNNQNAEDTGRSLKSSSIGNSEHSTLKYKTYFGSNQVISFHLKVSSEQRYDYLDFYVNDQLIQSWSGEVDWTVFEHEVSEGEVELKWVYRKDRSVFRGSDAAWIDNLKLINAPVLTQLRGDCCDQSPQVKPNSDSRYFSTEMICDDIQFSYTFDYNCNQTEEKLYTETDTRSEEISLFPLPKYRVVADLWIFGKIYSRLPLPTDRNAYCNQLKEDYATWGPGTCKQIWDTVIAPDCGEDGTMIWIYEIVNETTRIIDGVDETTRVVTVFNIPFPSERRTQRCR